MKYKILRTDKAEDQLREIIFYIADDSSNVDIALGYLERIETAINRLQEFPESGSIPRYSIVNLLTT
jgi:toxin ParE1/3/4